MVELVPVVALPVVLDEPVWVDEPEVPLEREERDPLRERREPDALLLPVEVPMPVLLAPLFNEPFVPVVPVEPSVEPLFVLPRGALVPVPLLVVPVPVVPTLVFPLLYVPVPAPEFPEPPEPSVPEVVPVVPVVPAPVLPA